MAREHRLRQAMATRLRKFCIGGGIINSWYVKFDMAFKHTMLDIYLEESNLNQRWANSDYLTPPYLFTLMGGVNLCQSVLPPTPFWTINKLLYPFSSQRPPPYIERNSYSNRSTGLLSERCQWSYMEMLWEEDQVIGQCVLSDIIVIALLNAVPH